jgi:hypothetical protein
MSDGLTRGKTFTRERQEANQGAPQHPAFPRSNPSRDVNRHTVKWTAAASFFSADVDRMHTRRSIQADFSHSARV